ncbi:ROK family protein [Carboxylicivirga sp. RSCT41]|uniref:ROK family protein n=1 Tax=Carboxylicivirga agarovorans TaxID=3417570 RepID=UPI003D33D1C5
MQKKLSIGVDVGGSHISCKVIDLNTRQLGNVGFNSLPMNNQGSKESVFETFAELINPCIQQVGKENVVGIGLAFPGPIDYENGVGQFTGENSKYQNLNQVNIREELRDRVDIAGDQIRFINDATAFAAGEYFNGELTGSCRSLAITLGTGFGAAFLDMGVPVISDEKVPEGGCLWHLPFDKGIADDYFSTRGLVERFNVLSNRYVEGVKEMAELYSTNHIAQEVFTDFGNKLALFLRPWLQKFEVDKMVIGGNISRAFHLFEGALNHGLKQTGLNVLVKPSSRLEDSAFIGAAMLLDDDFYQSVKEQLKRM